MTFCPVVGRCETVVRLHVIAGHELVGAGDEVTRGYLEHPKFVSIA